MSKKKAIIAGAAVVAVLVLGGLALGNQNQGGVEVRAERVTRRDLVATVTASGKIEPKRKVDISADVPGRVVELAVEEGQMVAAGDLLLRIDPTQYEAAVRRAEAAVSQAQAQASQARASLLRAQTDLRRAEQLTRDEDLIPRQQLEGARSDVAVAQASYEAARHAINQSQAALVEARDQLAKTTIRAPMAGRVTRVNIEEGETAIIGTMNNPGSLLLTVADLGEMEAKVKVDETDVPSISIGDSATVSIDAFPNQTFTGRVTRIANSSLANAATGQVAADGQSVDFEVVITLDAPPAELRPDLSATAEIITDMRSQALAIPILALTVRDPDGMKLRGEGEEDEGGSAARRAQREQEEVEGVYVVEAGKAKWVPVEVGIAGDRYFEVVSGLRGNEQVVSGTYTAIRNLQANQPVKVAAGGAASSAGAAKGEEEEGG